jgi:NAD(P)-dependent dehydrogenase (short-subunit alcohol dehydrogenase family)
MGDEAATHGPGDEEPPVAPRPAARASRTKLLRRRANPHEWPNPADMMYPGRMGLLDGKVAIITGGGRGLGRAEALRLAREGCAIVVDDIGCGLDGQGRDASVAEGVAAEIRDAGGRAVASAEDGATPEGAERLLRAAIDAFGKVDILVASTGILADAPLVETTPARFAPMFANTVEAPFHTVVAVAKHFVSRGAPGSILLTTSSAGLRGAAGMPLYSAAKAAIFGLGITAAIELAPHGINVNMLNPLAYTRMTEKALAEVPDAAVHFSPDHVAEVALYLVSDLGKSVNGAVVQVHGAQVSVSRVAFSEAASPASGQWSVDELSQRWEEITSFARSLTKSASRT